MSSILKSLILLYDLYILASESLALPSLAPCSGLGAAKELLAALEGRVPYIFAESSAYLQAVLRQNVAFFDRLGAGEVTNRVSHDAELVQDGISHKVCSLVWRLSDSKVSIVLSSLAAFFSAFIIAFVKQWKFALILSCIVPTIMAIFGVGGTFMAKYAQLVLQEYGTAATLSEEIISSVRTAQAFGTQEKLAKLYDNSLVSAQKIGYKQQQAGSIMLSLMFFAVYSFYALGFCSSC